MNRSNLKILLVAAALVVAGLGGLLVWLLQHPPQAEVVAAPAAAPAVPAKPAAPADPFADRQADAIALVRAFATARGPIGEELRDAATLFPSLVAAKPVWGASRLKDGVYEVSCQATIAGMQVGPRWGVQLDKTAVPAGGSAVVAGNAYAEILAAPSVAPWATAPLPADADVLRTLLSAAGPKELTLPAALLASMRTAAKAGRAVAPLGWSVALQRSKPPEKPAYAVTYAWTEDGATKSAGWEVDLDRRTVKPADLSANEVAATAAATDPKFVVQTLPPDVAAARGNPAKERKVDRRALRYLASEPLRMQAVSALLRFPDRPGTPEPNGWTMVETPTAGLFEATFSLRFGSDLEPAVWTVDTSSGAVQAKSGPALMIESLLAPAGPKP